MSDHRNVQIVNDMTAAIFDQDHDTLAKVFTDDLVFHLRGPYAMAGNHSGLGGFLGVLGSIARLIGLLAYVLVIAIGGLGAFAFRDSTGGAAASIAFAFLIASLGFIWAAFDRHRRALHDRIAGTIVVRIE